MTVAAMLQVNKAVPALPRSLGEIHVGFGRATERECG
jgi:hypothetical protein